MAPAPIGSLAWEPPHAVGAALKKKISRVDGYGDYKSKASEGSGRAVILFIIHKADMLQSALPQIHDKLEINNEKGIVHLGKK